MRTPPIDQTDALLTEAYHWHLEVSPKFTKTGGLELATQMNVLLTEPTQAAKNLRLVDTHEGSRRRGSCLVYSE